MLKTDNWRETLRTELRRATIRHHHQVDHHPVLAPLVRPEVTLAAYCRALVVLFGINGPVEERIRSYAAAEGLDWDHAARRRVPDLALDLAYFGIQLPPVSWEGPGIDSPARLVGCLYVLEGSTMGGQVIFRRLREVLGITPQAGGRFFAGHGSKTDIMWEQFWDFAAATCQPESLPQAVQAAQDLFTNYLALLNLHSES